MRLTLFTALTMLAFAANSVLNRLALADGAIGPAGFAAIRLGSGALALLVLVSLRGGGLKPALPRGFGGVIGPVMLALYVLGFSYAYVTLEAGVGALILFGGVQITMFAGAVLGREHLPLNRWVGAGVALAGLAYLLWPAGVQAPGMVGSVLMGLAAFGWGIYSLQGRKANDPLAATAVNFALAAPFGLVALILLPDTLPIRFWGAALAVMSGVVTSAFGYALWYSVLPRLPASIAAVVQLTVPVIALGGGIALLGEGLSLRFVIACTLVLGGVAFSVLKIRFKEPLN
jgi:drug/metabolite transporter (DMT)-like permease